MDAHQIATRSVKQANPLAFRTTPLLPEQRHALKADTGKYIASLAAALFGAGVLGRSGIGLQQLLQKAPSRDKTDTASHLLRLELPPEEEKQADWREWAGEQFARMTQTPDDQPSFWRGDHATSATGNPLFWGVGLPVGLASLYGGYKLTDSIMDSARKRARARELEAAKKRYRQLVEESMKHASADPTDVLDDMADTMCKQADGEQPSLGAHLSRATPAPVKNIAGGAAGLYGAYALLSALAAGKLIYDWRRKRMPSKITERALAERKRQRMHSSAAPSFARLERLPA